MPALDRLRAAGFEVALSAAGGLLVRPADRLTDAQRQWVVAHKTALLAALASEQPAPRPPNVVGMVGLVGLGQTDRDVHLPAPAPLLPADESRIRRYLTRIGEADPVTIAELLDVCRRDADARINTLALAIESESQPAPPPPPPATLPPRKPPTRISRRTLGDLVASGEVQDLHNAIAELVRPG